MAQTELKDRFSPNQPLEEDIAAELESIMRIYNISAEDLFFKWDSYCLKLDIDALTALTLKNVRNLKQNLLDELEKTQRNVHVKKERNAAATPRPKAGLMNKGSSDVYGMVEGLMPSTPASGGSKLGRVGGSSAKKTRSSGPGSSPASSMSSQLHGMNGLPPTSFVDRPNPGEIMEVLNESLPAAVTPIEPFPVSRIKLTAVSDQKKLAYKPLAMKLSEASEILDERIDDFTAIIQQHHSIEDSAIGSAASQGTTDIVAVGRIASDSREGKLNAASLVLETARRTGRGLRIPLKMDNIKSWSFFPGQIVALRGHNATGKEFLVKEILEIPLLPNAATDTSTLETHIERLRGGPDAMESDSDPTPLNIIFASGPYTADDNLDYEPLHTLCQHAADTYADALILTGPFLDVDHPLLATGDFDLPEEANFDPDTITMATVFKFLIAPAFNRLVSLNPSISIILVPSVRDIISKHVSWPQEAIVRKDLGLPKSARLISNPMTLFINESIIGVSSLDVLFELQSEALASGVSGDLKDRLCRYLIEQRHYYPVFPPTERKRLHKTGTEDQVATGSMLDLSYLKLGEMGNVRPDILLIPSALPAFARVVESVVAINPGYLSKRRGAGTYARMTLTSPKLESTDAAHLQGHSVYSRARVEIVKI